MPIDITYRVLFEMSIFWVTSAKIYLTSKSSVDKHVKRVHEKSAVPEKICETCGKAFWQESKLQTHILKVCGPLILLCIHALIQD